MKMNTTWVWISLISWATFSCSTTQNQSEGKFSESQLDQKTRKAAAELSQLEAAYRASKVSNVHYDLEVEVGTDSPDFIGTNKVWFDYAKDSKRPLTVDFTGGNVLSMEINGKKTANVDYNGFFISLPEDQLVKGRNSVKIRFSHPYSNSGDGLYRFKDPEDNRTYLYTDFEPYDANQMFPCFDQPDLKATYVLEVLAPRAWEVVTSVLHKAKIKRSRYRYLWKFPKSARFSTYIFSMHAGPYKIWSDRAGKIPLRLMARRSLAPHVGYREWFKITKQGFSFFENYFDYPYPYDKYDQIIVPDFNAGAMENVGAVTFTERYIYRGKAMRHQRERRANTILHEMAHMWFGNLVTMRWWNDLWLNESFATYMANLALAKATEFKEVWQTFFSRTKQWAYWEDQLVTTHPIEVPVPDTAQAFANFDGITYGKGASVLKQISFFIGAENFKKGMQKYFKKYAHRNTELRDFIGSLESAAGMDLSRWTDDWLRKASLNTIESKYDCEKGLISKFEIIQTAPDKHSTLRSHRTQVGFYKEIEGIVGMVGVIPVTYEGPKTEVKKAVGLSCPDLVYPNHGDNDFVKVKIDEKTLQFARKKLSQIVDPLVRMMFWQSLWDMVRDQQLSVVEYAKLVFDNLPKEKDINNVTNVGQSLYGRYSNSPSVLFYLPVEGDENEKFKKEFIEKLERFFWAQLEKSEAGSDFQKFWFDSYVSSAHTKNAGGKIKDILDEKIKFDKFRVDQDRRWELVQRLTEMNLSDSETYLEKERKKDSSERGQKMSLAAEVSKPDLEVKRKWWDDIISLESKHTLGRMRSVMWNLFPREQVKLREKFKKDYYAKLPALTLQKSEEFLDSFSDSMVPALCEMSSVEEIGEFIEDHKKLPAVVIKNLRVARQEDERCVRIRELARTAIRKAQNNNQALIY